MRGTAVVTASSAWLRASRAGLAPEPEDDRGGRDLPRETGPAPPRSSASGGIRGDLATLKSVRDSGVES